MMHTLSMELFGAPLALADFPVLKSVRGLGLSDNRKCASMLEVKFDYRNTFYHQEPRFDVTKAPSNEQDTYDFVLAGEIFEHVAPPIEAALANICRLLKPSGFLVLTAPYSTEATTREHFPRMQDYKVVSVGERLALLNRTQDGEWQVFENVVFHGGDGSTVEMRLFSETNLRDSLLAGGFRQVQYKTEDYPPFGIVHEGSWGVPAVAGQEAFRLRRESIAEVMAQHFLQTTRQGEELQRQQSERVRLEALCRDLNAHVEQVGSDLEEKSRWSLSLNQEIERNRHEIERLQAHEQELRTWAQTESEESKRLQLEVKRLQLESEERTQWALRLTEDVKQRSQDAERLAHEIALLRGIVQTWEASRWSHLGRVFGLGPKVS
jgi:hypothetical protein